MSERKSYDWDVFISYRRVDEWSDWVTLHFKPLLTQWLRAELTEAMPPPRVFLDYDELRQGQDWPTGLGIAHARSAVLVPLLAPQYFYSDWCTAELRLMAERERHCGYRTGTRNDVLVVPAVVHDGQRLPKEWLSAQAPVLNDYTNPRMEKRGALAAALSDAIKAWAPDIAQAVESAPPLDDGWHDPAVEEMKRTYDIAPLRQMTVPRLAA